MINGGATFKFGDSPEKKAVPERYRNGPISSVLVLHDEMVAMKEAYGREITVLAQENNHLRQDIAVLQQEMQALRAMVHKQGKSNQFHTVLFSLSRLIRKGSLGTLFNILLYANTTEAS